MNRGVEEPLAPALGTLTVARILGDVGDQTRIEDALPIVRRIKAAIEIEIGPLRSSPTSLATSFNAFRPSGNRTISVSLTGATGTGAKTYPWLSIMAMTLSPFWCLWPE